MTIEQKFGSTIVRLRKEKHLSQERFAGEAGVSTRYMSDVENGIRNISLDIIEKIAKQLDMTISELFAEVEKVK